MKNMGSLAWKNNFFSPCFSKCYSYRNNLLDKVRQMFFSPPPPSLSLDGMTFSRAQLKNLWKKKHTHSLRRWRCLGLRITEVQIGSPCQNYSCTKDGTTYQPRAQKDFFRFSRTLRKRSCAVHSQALLAQPGPNTPTPPPPTLRQISKGASLLKDMIKEYVPVCTCHLRTIYCQGIPFVTSYNMFS